MRTRWFKAVTIAMGVSLTGPAWGLGGGGAPGPTLEEGARRDWAPLLREGAGEGISSEALEHAAAHLADAGLSPGESRAILEPAFRAARSGLPAEPVLGKIAEGSLKGAAAGDLVRAAETRLEALSRAREVLTRNGYPDGADRARGLVVATALALESGLPAAALAAALERGAASPPGHVKAVVEAGEALHLEGLDPETVTALMVDCLDRNLRRPEILRVVNFAREQHRLGLDGPAVREALWGSPRGSGARGAGMGETGGPGSGGPAGAQGSAPGGPGAGLGGPGGGSGRPPRGGHR